MSTLLEGGTALVKVIRWVGGLNFRYGKNPKLLGLALIVAQPSTSLPSGTSPVDLLLVQRRISRHRRKMTPPWAAAMGQGRVHGTQGGRSAWRTTASALLPHGRAARSRDARRVLVGQSAAWRKGKRWF